MYLGLSSNFLLAILLLENIYVIFYITTEQQNLWSSLPFWIPL